MLVGMRLFIMESDDISTNTVMNRRVFASIEGARHAAKEILSRRAYPFVGDIRRTSSLSITEAEKFRAILLKEIDRFLGLDGIEGTIFWVGSVYTTIRSIVIEP